MKNLELPFIKDMFDTIAPRYDFLNRFLSMRQDVYWRRKLVSAVDIPLNGKLLDVACGTCDVALEALKQKGGNVSVVGADFSPGMLVLGREKVLEKGAEGNIHLLAGNALCLPFPEESFDSVTIAFGIRNIADKATALSNFHACLKKGGTLGVLELATPTEGFFRDLYLLYFRKVLPFIGGFFSKNQDAYKYLPDSVLNFPPADEFARLVSSAGFRDVTWKKMTLGIVTLYVGRK